MLNDLLVHNVIHELEPLHRFLLCDADELLLQGHRSETVVEEKQPFFGIDSQERGHILVVGESGTQTHQADVFLRGFNVANSPETQTIKGAFLSTCTTHKLLLWILCSCRSSVVQYSLSSFCVCTK